MSKITLTTAAVQKLKAAPRRRKIPDGGAQGLCLVIQPSGTKSWALRLRLPGGRGAKLTLGPVDLTGREVGDAPQIGAPLTLAAARQLANAVQRQRARGLAVAAAEKRRRQHAIDDAARSTFAGAARDYVEQGRRTKERNRGWRNTAKVLGLIYPDEGEVTFVKGGLAERWRDKPIADVTADDLHVLVEEARPHIGIGKWLKKRPTCPPDATLIPRSGSSP